MKTALHRLIVALVLLALPAQAQTWSTGDYQLNRKKSTAGFEVAELLAGSNLTITWDNTAKTATLAAPFTSWTGSSSITTLGTITTGTWNATPITSAYIGTDAITSSKILDGQVTLAKLANLAAERLIGRGAGSGTGVPQAITLGNSLEWSGTTIQVNPRISLGDDGGTGGVLGVWDPTVDALANLTVDNGVWSFGGLSVSAGSFLGDGSGLTGITASQVGALEPNGDGSGLTGTATSLTAGSATAALGLKTATTTVAIDAATAPSTGQVLTATSSTAATWQTPLGGNLTDPNADRILFWDDSAGNVAWLTAGSGLTISGTTITASGSGGAWGTITGTLSDQTDLNSALSGKQPLDATLTAFAGLANGADKLPYFTGSDTMTTTTLSTFARTLLDDGSASTMLSTLGGGTGAQGTGGIVLSVSPTLTSPKFADLGYIADAASQEMLIFDSVTSAVNELTLSNAASGNSPTISATGSSTDIGINFVPKGTGAVSLGGGTSASELRFLEPSAGGTSYTGFKSPALAGNVIYTLPTTDGTSGQALSTNGSGVLSWASAGGSIGGTVGTTDNRIPRADGTGGSTLQASLVSIGDTGLLTSPVGLAVTPGTAPAPSIPYGTSFGEYNVMFNWYDSSTNLFGGAIAAPSTYPSSDLTWELPATSGTLLLTNGSGASLTALNASNIASGTVPTARLGSGTADSTTYLRGDNTWATPAGGVTSVTGTANEITVTGTTTPTLSLPSALTFTGKTVTGGTYASASDISSTGILTLSKNGALSAPTVAITGTPITGGTATTTKPLALIEPSGTTSTNWSTSGTAFGVNAPNGFATAGNIADFQVDGTRVLAIGRATFGSLTNAAEFRGGGTYPTSLVLNGGNATAYLRRIDVGWIFGAGWKWAAVSSDARLGFTAAAANGIAPTGEAEVDTGFVRDSAGAMAQRNGTSAQVSRLYDTYTSSTDYHRLAMATVRISQTATAGATITLTGLIPDGAVVMGVTSKVTTTLTGGVTGYQVGTGADPDRWGVAATATLGTTTDNRDWTNGAIECFTAATDVILTANGASFSGTGVIYVSVQYMTGQAD